MLARQQCSNVLQHTLDPMKHILYTTIGTCSKICIFMNTVRYLLTRLSESHTRYTVDIQRYSI